MIRGACVTTERWHQFLDDFADDEDLIARLKDRSPR